MKKITLTFTVDQIGALLHAAQYADQHDDEGLRSGDLEAKTLSRHLEQAMGKLFTALKNA